MSGQVEGQVDGQVEGQVDGQVDSQVVGQVDGQVGGQGTVPMGAVSCVLEPPPRALGQQANLTGWPQVRVQRGLCGD